MSAWMPMAEPFAERKATVFRGAKRGSARSCLVQQVAEAEEGGDAVAEADGEQPEVGVEGEGGDGRIELRDSGEPPGLAVPDAKRAVDAAGNEEAARGIERRVAG